MPTIRQFYRTYPGRTAGLVFVDGSLRELALDATMVETFMAALTSGGLFLPGQVTENASQVGADGVFGSHK